MSRRAAALQLAPFVALLLAAYVAFFVLDLVDTDDVRALVDPFGALAPVAYVVVAALLGAALVPGPILAGTSGLLFGALTGTVVTLSASVLGAVLALLAARRVARRPVETLSGERLQALAHLARRHGVAAVVVQRLAPAIPDAPCSYAFGAVGVRVWQIAVGTAIGAAPRAFSYTSLGASLDDPSSPLAIAGVAGIVLTGIVGAEIIRRLVMRDRARGTGSARRT